MIETILIIQEAGIIIIWPVSLILLILILLQGGAGDISSSFGGGGQLDSSLGVGAASKISKVTGWLTAVFLLLVVVLSINPDGALNAADVVQDPDAAAAEVSTEAVTPAEKVTEPAVVVPTEGSETTAEVKPSTEPAPEVKDETAPKPEAAAPEIEVVE